MRKLVLLFLTMTVLCSSGCLFTRYTWVPDRYPVYPVPAKAVIAKVSAKDLEPLTPEVRLKIVQTVTGLKAEAAQLRATLESYNKYAEKKNEKYEKIFKRKHR